MQLSTIKTYLNIPAADSTQDALVDLMREHALGEIESATNRNFSGLYTVTEYLSPSGGRFLYLRDIPTGLLPLIEVSYIYGDYASPVLSTEYAVEGSTLIHRSGWSAGKDNVRVTYEAGTEALPADVERMLLKLIAYDYRQRQSVGYKSQSIGGYSYSVAETVPGWDAFVKRWRYVNI